MLFNKKHKIPISILPLGLIVVLELVIANVASSQIYLFGYAMNRILITQFLGFVFVAGMGFYSFFVFRWRIGGIVMWIMSLVIIADVIQIARHV